MQRRSFFSAALAFLGLGGTASVVKGAPDSDELDFWKRQYHAVESMLFREVGDHRWRLEQMGFGGWSSDEIDHFLRGGPFFVSGMGSPDELHRHVYVAEQDCRLAVCEILGMPDEWQFAPANGPTYVPQAHPRCSSLFASRVVHLFLRKDPRCICMEILYTPYVKGERRGDSHQPFRQPKVVLYDNPEDVP